MTLPVAQITSGSDRHYQAAVDLLVRFFEEEGFTTPRERIAQNLQHLVADDGSWAAVLLDEQQAVGVITISTALSVELGHVAEIGDLYVAPAQRGRARAAAGERRDRVVPTAWVQRRVSHGNRGRRGTASIIRLLQTPRVCADRAHDDDVRRLGLRGRRPCSIMSRSE